MPQQDITLAFFLQDLDGGGAERAIIRLAGEIAERGYPVDLVVGDANSDYLVELSPRLNLVDFSTRSYVLLSWRLLTYLQCHPPTVIMSALDPPNIILVAAARLLRFKGRVVISQRAVLDASLREYRGMHRIAIKFLVRFLFPYADALISNSRAAARELAERLGIVPDKIFTIHNAINMGRIQQLAQEPLPTWFPEPLQPPLIVSVGSLTRRKDMATLIRAFALVREQRSVRLIIVGKGPEQAALERLIAVLGVEESTWLVGFEANPYKWLAAASILVSASREEGFPNVIAESLALGCPVVVTDCPGDTAELLEQGKWGRLVPVADAERMAAAIVAALDDPNPPDGRIRAADFAPASNAAAYLSVLLPAHAPTSRASTGEA